MEGPKGWKEFCRLAGTAILKFETDKDELLEVTIFADRTTSRTSLWNASFQCGDWQHAVLLSGNADSEAYEDSILWKMVEISKVVIDGSPICTTYGIYFNPIPYSGYKIIREIESERAVRFDLTRETKWEEFPEEIKAVFNSSAEKGSNSGRLL